MSASISLINGSPGVYKQEDDLSGYVSGVATSVGAIVFAAKQGSITPTFVTSPSIFTSMYGLSDISWGYGHISAKAFLKQGNCQLWCLRVPGDNAKYAGASICYSNPQGSGPYLNVVNYLSNSGTNTGYTNDGGLQIQNTILSTALIAGSSITGTIATSGISVNINTIGFSTDQPTTLAALTTAINSALSNLFSIYQATVPNSANLAGPNATLIDNNYGIIAIVSPENVSLTIEFTVSNNGAATTLNLYESNLIDIFAANPGIWAKDIGYNITNIDPGIFQRSTLTFSAPLLVGNVVTIILLVNNQAIEIGPYTVTTGQSSDQAIANIITLINQALNTSGSTNVYTTYPNGFGANYARVINLVAPVSGPGYLGMQSYTITGGSSQSALYFNETMAGVVSSGTFVFNVFNRSNQVNPIASYTASLQPQLDGLNNQIFLEHLINTVNANSTTINVKVNAALVASGVIIDPKLAAQFASITFLGGGNDGTVPTSSDLINAWNTFSNTETYQINTLINAGYTDSAVQQNIANIASTRKDCIAIIDVPSDVQDVQSCYTWRTTQSNINTSYVSLVSPDILYLDPDTNQQLLVPRSGFDAARYVYTDQNFTVWNAPAGYDRGRLPDALDLRFVYEKSDRDLLDSVQINCAKKARDGSGILIYAENTAQTNSSLLSSIAVRRNLNYIENSIVQAVEKNLFDLNTQQLAFILRKRIEAFLEPIKNGGGLSRYQVVISADNNPAIFADAGQLNISVYMTPIRPVRIILLDAVIVSNTINFNEIIIGGST